ncbi:WG repeat-containing protein [Fluviicola taffensis]|uniref:WG repeat-containing protein n=1 Tax=Fluviicola taffensis TaxID=191579 RepID=UPI0031377AF4
MNETPYNQLPQNIKRVFRVVYSELVADEITVFKNQSEKWGVLAIVKRFGLFWSHGYLVRPIYDSIGFIKSLNLIEAVKYENDTWNRDKNTYLYYDLNGKLVWQSKSGERTSIDDFGNVFLNRKEQIGLLDSNFTQLITPKYEQLQALNAVYLKALQDGKYGIVNRNDILVLDFDFTEIFTAAENNQVIVKKDKTYFVFDPENSSLAELPFSKLLNASSNTYGAPSPESYNYFKSITDLEEDEDPYYDEYDGYEMIHCKGKWGIIDRAGKVIIPNDYCYVDFLRNPKYFKVGIGEIEVFDYEDTEKQSRTAIRNVKWGIIDIHNTIVVPVEYDWIDEVESTIWVVYKGGTVFYNDDYQENYWTIEKGKLGVYNLSTLITPIEYDSILKNWFRIKDYIFVQKEPANSEYDVYTLDGKKIESNKPNPRNHMSNGE